MGGPGSGQDAQEDANDYLDEYDKLLEFLASERDKAMDSKDYQRAHILETQRLGIETAVNEMKDPNAEALSAEERAQKVAEKITESVHGLETLKGMSGAVSTQEYMQDYLTKNPKLAQEAMTDVQELVSHKVNSMNFGNKTSAVRGMLSTLAMDSYENMTARPETPAQKAGLAPTDYELAQENDNKNELSKDRDQSRDRDNELKFQPGV